eukprot:m.250028 g.250028  ORF g.250028 m.250028 type:complete len:381 (+) comp19093_c0_seq12:124-1266(+)
MRLPTYKTYGRQELHDPEVSVLYYVLLVTLVVASLYHTLFGHGHLLHEIPLSSTTMYTSSPLFAAAEVTERARCGQPEKNTTGCIVLSADDATFRESKDTMLIATHVFESLQRRGCDPHEDTCVPARLWNNVRKSTTEPGCAQRDHAVADVDDFVVSLEHAVLSMVDPSLSRTQREMNGTLLDVDGATMVTLDQPVRDALALRQLLGAAGVDGLDHKHDSRRSLLPCADWLRDHPDACCEDFGATYRVRGLHLDLIATYANLADGSMLPRDMTYELRAMRMPLAEAYLTEFLPGCKGFEQHCGNVSDAEALKMFRVKRTISGVRLSMQRTGDVGHFTWSAAAQCLVGLSAAATLSWNLVELFCELHPTIQGKLYEKTKVA